MRMSGRQKRKADPCRPIALSADTSAPESRGRDT
ncbi:hypothetical protein GGR73_001431 [Xanthomonas sp. F14]|nr:hypothetical protein [Xanthomonas arboricola]